ncbi:DUF1428 family protein [Devosia sp.]|uniref:DUF1428 domain-containing protein n=1 Tax=Devosia sp. TaxID=1871048 RepID=UPI0032641514
MSYIDGFAFTVPRSNLEDYKKLAQRTAELFKDLGATGYAESVADDVSYGKITSFPRAVMASDDDVVILQWIQYASKADRNRIGAEVMQDPRMKAIMAESKVDMKHMIYGGFQTFVSF